MNVKTSSFFVLAILSGAAIVSLAQASSKNESQLLAQIERNETQIDALEQKIKALEKRLGNVEVGLGKAHAQLEWKVEPLASGTE